MPATFHSLEKDTSKEGNRKCQLGTGTQGEKTIKQTPVVKKSADPGVVAESGGHVPGIRGRRSKTAVGYSASPRPV